MKTLLKAVLITICCTFVFIFTCGSWLTTEELMYNILGEDEEWLKKM